MTSLAVKQPYTFKGLSVPDATVVIDWVSFDRVGSRAEFVVGIYATPDEASTKSNRLEAVHLVMAKESVTRVEGEGEDAVTTQEEVDQYAALLAAYPAIFEAIVEGVNEIAEQRRGDLFQVK